jgi:uncharacterized protein YwgA
MVNSLAIGGILKRLYKEFDMGLFLHRLRVQKIIYLLQESGINLGYNFSWYFYGPYSAELTRDAFQIGDFNNIKPIGFENLDIEKKFYEFISRIEKHKEDNTWLEVASSILLLRRLYPEKKKEQIIVDIKKKRKELENLNGKINSVWEELKGWLIPNSK